MKTGSTPGLIWLLRFLMNVWSWASNELMFISPTLPDPKGLLITWPCDRETVIVCSAAMVGVPSNTWYPVFVLTPDQKFPRWNASSYWVLPRSVPPWLKSMPALNSGEASVFCVTVLPFDTVCEFGSKVMFPFLLPYTILIGTTTTGIVVEVFVVFGLVPIIT